MKRSLASILSLMLALSTLSVALLAGPRAFGQLRLPSASSTMDVSEIRPGMRGHGLTVFRGTQPERFEVEVIDILHQFRPDQDLVLVRTLHPILEQAPTVGGMSGSPIYLEDRLIGAYAYGWPFGRQPVAGVTPIANMLRELSRPVRPDSFPGAIPLAIVDGRRSASLGSPAPRPRVARGERPYLGEASFGALGALHAQRETLTARTEAAGRYESMTPASTPLLVGGLEPSAVAMLAAELAPLGLDVLQAGGDGTAAAPSAAHYVDGGALAVTLARGDIASNVVGTVTHVAGDRLIAFGHPMIEAGETGLPAAVARVLHVLASVQRSFKIAEPVAPLGALIHDRQSAIVIDQNLRAAMIPVRLRLDGVPDAQRREWNFEVASHRALTPLLVFTSLASAIKSVSADAAHAMFEASSRVWVNGMSQPIAFIDRGYSPTGPSAASLLQAIRAFDVIELAYTNPFFETRPDRIEIDLALRFGRETAEIVDAHVDATEVDPGSRVEVHVVLRPYGRPEETRTLTVDVPENAAGESIQILVQAGPDVEIERPEPRNLEDSIDAVRERYGPTSMVLSTRRPSRGLRMAGHVVRALPASALDALQRTGDSDRARAFTTHARQELPGDVVLSGGARVELEVRRVARPR